MIALPRAPEREPQISATASLLRFSPGLLWVVVPEQRGDKLGAVGLAERAASFSAKDATAALAPRVEDIRKQGDVDQPLVRLERARRLERLPGQFDRLLMSTCFGVPLAEEVDESRVSSVLESRQAALCPLDCLGGAPGGEQRFGDQLVTVRAGAVLREDGDERIDIVLGSGEVLHDLRQPEAPGVPRAA